jgi:hypothetical protein
MEPLPDQKNRSVLQRIDTSVHEPACNLVLALAERQPTAGNYYAAVRVSRQRHNSHAEGDERQCNKHEDALFG